MGKHNAIYYLKEFTAIEIFPVIGLMPKNVQGMFFGNHISYVDNRTNQCFPILITNSGYILYS